jgi:hypothetical protein
MNVVKPEKDIISTTPRRLFYNVRAQTRHSVVALEPAKLLTLDIPFSTSNINFAKFTGKLVKITAIQVDLHDWDGANITAGTFDGIQFSLNLTQPYGQTNDYSNPYSLRPNNSLLFLGAGELLSNVVPNAFTYRVPNMEEGVVVYMDGSPLRIQLTDWSGVPFTTGLDCGFVGVDSWWSILLRIEALN